MKTTKTYIVKTNVDYNNVRYEAGDTIVLTDKHAGPLLECGAIVLAPEQSS